MILKRIKYSSYDELFEKLDNIELEIFFQKDKNPLIELVENSSESIIYNNNVVDISINIDEYMEINKKSMSSKESSVELAKKLYNDFVVNGERLPTKLMYEKEFWTYMNLTIFFDLIKEKYFYDLNKKPELSDKERKDYKDKIKRQYFNYGGFSKIDRTGLRYLWVTADLVHLNNDFSLLQIAWDFIDPFRAIQECVLGNNPYVLKAFVKSIQILECDHRIKNKKNRGLVPLHIRNYACNHFVDAYTNIDELANIFAEQIKLIMSIAG